MTKKSGRGLFSEETMRLEREFVRNPHAFPEIQTDYARIARSLPPEEKIRPEDLDIHFVPKAH